MDIQKHTHTHKTDTQNTHLRSTHFHVEGPQCKSQYGASHCPEDQDGQIRDQSLYDRATEYLMLIGQ